MSSTSSALSAPTRDPLAQTLSTGGDVSAAAAPMPPAQQQPIIKIEQPASLKGQFIISVTLPAAGGDLASMLDALETARHIVRTFTETFPNPTKPESELV